MKRGRTALTVGQHVTRARACMGISKKLYKRMRNHLGAYIDTLIQVERKAFGTGPNPRVSVLLVPELRKRRSERDPVLLQQQIQNAANTEAAFKIQGRAE